ncbi:lipocalin-like domain-containing protein [Thauera sinica]|uniref:Lipocalin-like domain-containing protein n=1 Tax=Thauera sinica TaxID=2665146 RepID=A0ABW1AUB9_9RHOO|nr:carotenoid 1,2-hydratase [Thauera sp. K11]
MAALWCALFAGTGLCTETAAEADFPPVLRGTPLDFPRDLGAHPAFRTEWWYVTGWITDEAGIERGFQVTFFRVRTGIGERSKSRFAPTQLVLAHAAIADPALGRLRHAQRAERAHEPLAGADAGRTRAWVRDWLLEGDGGRYRTRIAADAFSFELDFLPAGPPLLNGHDGFSRKAPDPRHASHYYSRPQLAVAGTLTLEGRRHEVRGQAWLDHEWSSELMPERAKGWDWIGINLRDGGSLMAFRMRDDAGGALWSAFTLVEHGRTQRREGPDAVRFTPLRTWRSPRTGAEYPVEWELELPATAAGGGHARRLRLVPLMDDQELDSARSTGAIYWEGAVRVLEAPGGAGADEAHSAPREFGRGYLEMTGYADRPGM